MATENGIPVLSFYSGGGFLDMGFEMAGFEIVWTNEFDPVFAELHAAGITSWRQSQGNGTKAEIFNVKSLVDVTAEEIVEQAFPQGKPEVFGIIGGPPCQDFTSNGKQAGFEGDRGKMTLIFFDRILALRPAFFVMENVTGLTRGKSTRQHLKHLLKNVEKEFEIDHASLNALEFGVPQSRERVFFIGVRRDLMKNKKTVVALSGNWFPWPEHPVHKNAATKYAWPAPIVFGKKLSKPKGIPIELCVQSCLVAQSALGDIANATEYFNMYVKEKKLKCIKEGETNRPSFKRLHRFKYSPTACYGNNEVHLHPYRHRRLSVREALRIQGVPDTYILPAEIQLTKKFKMIGNGVPVPLAKAVATSLIDFLSECKTKDDGYMVKAEAQRCNAADTFKKYKTGNTVEASPL